MEKIKILVVTPSLSVCGGIESYCMNYYRHLDDRFAMDFVTHSKPDQVLLDELKYHGSRVDVLPPFSLKCLPETLGVLRKFFKKRSGYYDIIHCNMANAACFYFPYAEKSGIKVRIIHSHQNKAADTVSHAIRNIPLLYAGEKMANYRLACSALAGDFLFPKNDYTIIKNAIDSKHYIFDHNKRAAFRSKYNIGDSILLGTVGRLTEQKNQKKLIDIMNILVNDMHLDHRLVIAGEGHLLNELNLQIEKYGLTDRVILLGSVDDVPGVLSAMDIFVLPSIYEGLGIVNIEAAACGLPVVVSDGVPDDADMGGTYIKIPLAASDLEWANHIKKISPSDESERSSDIHISRIKERGYDINTEASKLADYYTSALSPK